jgi:hypothetical protein
LEECASGIGSEDFVQHLARGFGAIFLNLDTGEADRGSGSEWVGGLDCHDP